MRGFLPAIVLIASIWPTSAQSIVTDVRREGDLLTLKWRGGVGPFLTETSSDLVRWSDQGEPASVSQRTLPAFSPQGFYRVADLNPSGSLGALFGLVQTEQGEFGGILARHRLKTRIWLHKTKSAPHTSASFTVANYFRKLIGHYQYHEDGLVRTWTGPLENLGEVATPANQRMTIAWTRGEGAKRQAFLLTLEFPYNINANRAAAPLPSDPTYQLQCTRATPEREFDGQSLKPVTVDSVTLVEMAPIPDGQSFPQPRKYTVRKNGAQVNLHFREWLPLHEGGPPFIFKTFLLESWLSPATGGGGGLPSFSTDSYFSLTLLPGHHNFVEFVLIEPGLDPALSPASRSAFAAANIRYIHTFKDLDTGTNSEDIRYIGFDNTLRGP